MYDDPRVLCVFPVPLNIVRDFLWAPEGANSPVEFELVWRSIFWRKFESDRIVFVHFGDFSDEVER